MSRSLTLFLTASLALVMFSACDQDAPIDSPTQTTPPTSVIDPTQSTGGGSVSPDAPVVSDDTENIPVPTFEGLGEEDPSKLIPVGTLNGTWRVGINDVNKVPVMHIDFVHDKGAATATCDFVMYGGLEANFAEKVGKCKTVSLQGDTLALVFNPTEQFDYEMTLTTNAKPDADTFTGTIAAPHKDGVDTWDVKLERRQFDPTDDGVRPAAKTL